MKRKIPPLLLIGFALNGVGFMLGNSFTNILPSSWISTAIIVAGWILMIVGIVQLRKRE